MVELGPISQQLVFAARPEYLSLTYDYMSGCPKYKGTTCLHIPTTQMAHTYHTNPNGIKIAIFLNHKNRLLSTAEGSTLRLLTMMYLSCACCCPRVPI